MSTPGDVEMAQRHNGHTFYQRISELQDKLKRSEEERLKLEENFKILMRSYRDEEENRLAMLKAKYEQFLEDEKRRKERNERILQTLDRIESRSVMLTSKSERLQLMRRHYEAYLATMYPTWTNSHRGQMGKTLSLSLRPYEPSRSQLSPRSVPISAMNEKLTPYPVTPVKGHNPYPYFPAQPYSKIGLRESVGYSPVSPVADAIQRDAWQGSPYQKVSTTGSEQKSLFSSQSSPNQYDILPNKSMYDPQDSVPVYNKPTSQPLLNPSHVGNQLLSSDNKQNPILTPKIEVSDSQYLNAFQSDGKNIPTNVSEIDCNQTNLSEAVNTAQFNNRNGSTDSPDISDIVNRATELLGQRTVNETNIPPQKHLVTEENKPPNSLDYEVEQNTSGDLLCTSLSDDGILNSSGVLHEEEGSIRANMEVSGSPSEGGISNPRQYIDNQQSENTTLRSLEGHGDQQEERVDVDGTDPSLDGNDTGLGEVSATATEYGQGDGGVLVKGGVEGDPYQRESIEESAYDESHEENVKYDGSDTIDPQVVDQVSREYDASAEQFSTEGQYNQQELGGGEYSQDLYTGDGNIPVAEETIECSNGEQGGQGGYEAQAAWQQYADGSDGQYADGGDGYAANPGYSEGQTYEEQPGQGYVDYDQNREQYGNDYVEGAQYTTEDQYASEEMQSREYYNQDGDQQGMSESQGYEYNQEWQNQGEQEYFQDGKYHEPTVGYEFENTYDAEESPSQQHYQEGSDTMYNQLATVDEGDSAEYHPDSSLEQLPESQPVDDDIANQNYDELDHQDSGDLSVGNADTSREGFEGGFVSDSTGNSEVEGNLAALITSQPSTNPPPDNIPQAPGANMMSIREFEGSELEDSSRSSDLVEKRESNKLAEGDDTSVQYVKETDDDRLTESYEEQCVDDKSSKPKVAGLTMLESDSDSVHFDTVGMPNEDSDFDFSENK